MIDLSDLRHALGRARAHMRRSRRTRRVPEAGRPEGLDAPLLHAVCRAHLDELPVTVEHIHLSPYKAIGGASRIFITTLSGRRWSLIYKECRYEPELSPGPERLQVVLGPAEHAVYSTGREPLRTMLPSVYHAEEVRHGRWYRYLLEDLGNTHRKAVSPRDLRSVAGRLTEFHTSLESWAHMAGIDPLLVYDNAFMLKLGTYAGETLASYRHRFNDDLLGESTLRRVLDFVQARRIHDLMTPVVVHGDLNRASVLVSRSSLKAVDWEWAGVGLPHIDLAILLEHADTQTTRRAIDSFANQRPDVSADDHVRLFRWARAATCTLNATMLAAELLAGGPAPRANRSTTLRRFMTMAVVATNES